jgi:hypothetical protein
MSIESINTEVSSGYLSNVGEPGDLPTMPDPSKNNPERGPHLPTMPDPAEDPERGQHFPAEPDPSEKAPHINDPVPVDGEDGERERIA